MLQSILFASLFIYSSRAFHANLGTSQFSLRSRLQPLHGIDVSGLPVDLSPESIISSANLQDTTSTIQNALILVFGVGYLVAEKRPRGSCRNDLIDIRKSSLVSAGQGVFAKAFIPEGTVLGVFPGFVTTPEAALERKKSDKAREAAKKYMWALNEELVLDPTNANGVLPLELPYFFGLYKADTTLARINEPPLGKDCNAYSRITGEMVEIVTERNIFANEEIFIDYGNFYDRSSYDESDEAKALQKKRLIEKARRAREEEEMMTLQPVTRSDDGLLPKAGTSSSRSKVDQDTSLPSGFLSKLQKKEAAKEGSEDNGILSPEDAMDMFTTMGAGMFSPQSEEDRELIARYTVLDKVNSFLSRRIVSGVMF